MAGLDRWLTDFLKPTNNEPTKPTKQVMKVLKVASTGISTDKDRIKQQGRRDAIAFFEENTNQ